MAPDLFQHFHQEPPSVGLILHHQHAQAVEPHERQAFPILRVPVHRSLVAVFVDPQNTDGQADGEG
jgi:hypothetical protein